MSCSVLFAIKRAVEDARKDMGIDDILILGENSKLSVHQFN